MCADYLSRFMENARHENITIKFSNKLPKLKEETFWDEELQIPEHYKINNNPVTYKELVNLFKKTPVPGGATIGKEKEFQELLGKAKSNKKGGAEQFNYPEEDKTGQPEFQEIL